MLTSSRCEDYPWVSGLTKDDHGANNVTFLLVDSLWILQLDLSYGG